MPVKIYRYTLPGEPIPVARVAEVDTPTIWNTYKQKKLNYKISLTNQHNEEPVIEDPIEATIDFFMPNQYKTKPSIKPHAINPSIFALFNFCEHCLVGIVIKRDCQIIKTTLKKTYDCNPRTEIKIKRIG